MSRAEPLSPGIRIAEDNGTPTPEFRRVWEGLRVTTSTTQETLQVIETRASFISVNYTRQGPQKVAISYTKPQPKRVGVSYTQRQSKRV